MKKLARKDTKLILTLSSVELADGKVAVSKIADVSKTANSMDAPGAMCGGGSTFVTYNTDDYHWFNITVQCSACSSPVPTHAGPVWSDTMRILESSLRVCPLRRYVLLLVNLMDS